MHIYMLHVYILGGIHCSNWHQHTNIYELGIEKMFTKERCPLWRSYCIQNFNLKSILDIFVKHLVTRIWLTRVNTQPKPEIIKVNQTCMKKVSHPNINLTHNKITPATWSELRFRSGADDPKWCIILVEVYMNQNFHAGECQNIPVICFSYFKKFLSFYLQGILGLGSWFF